MTARRVSRYARKLATAASSTSPPSAVRRPRTAPCGTRQPRLPQRQSFRLTDGPWFRLERMNRHEGFPTGWKILHEGSFVRGGPSGDGYEEVVV